MGNDIQIISKQCIQYIQYDIHIWRQSWEF
jgi:hypothetical protein